MCTLLAYAIDGGLHYAIVTLLYVDKTADFEQF